MNLHIYDLLFEGVSLFHKNVHFSSLQKLPLFTPTLCSMPVPVVCGGEM